MLSSWVFTSFLCLVTYMHNSYILLLCQMLKNTFFPKTTNKAWKTSQIFTHCNSVRITLLCCGNEQLQKSQWLNKADVYFLFILHFQHRSVGSSAFVIPHTPKLTKASFCQVILIHWSSAKGKRGKLGTCF